MSKKIIAESCQIMSKKIIVGLCDCEKNINVESWGKLRLKTLDISRIICYTSSVEFCMNLSDDYCLHF